MTWYTTMHRNAKFHLYLHILKISGLIPLHLDCSFCMKSKYVIFRVRSFTVNKGKVQDILMHPFHCVQSIHPPIPQFSDTQPSSPPPVLSLVYTSASHHPIQKTSMVSLDVHLHKIQTMCCGGSLSPCVNDECS